MRFDPLSHDAAPEGSRRLTEATAKKLGFVPSPVAKAARSPALLAHLLAGFAAFERSSLDALEREVVAMTVAFEVGCEYCMALHSASLVREATPRAVLEALRSGTALPEKRLDALRRYALGVLRDRGRVEAAVAADFEAAGYGEESALDVALGVGVYFLSTTTNVLTHAELDPPFAMFRWKRP